MSKNTSSTVLDTERFRKSIITNPDFIEERSQGRSFESGEQRRDHLQRAVALGALAVASKLEREGSVEDELDVNLFKMVANLHEFNDSSEIMDNLRAKYRDRRMSDRDWAEFKARKNTVMEFNRTLREVINTGAKKFDFDQLLTFMTDVFAETGGKQDVNSFYRRARTTLIGARTEEAFEQLLISAGINYEPGTIAQDAKGGDFIIEGVPFDVKSSLGSVEHARERALEMGHSIDTIVWSHVEPEDFNGKLLLSDKANKAIFARLWPDLQKALHQHTYAQAA